MYLKFKDIKQFGTLAIFTFINMDDYSTWPLSGLKWIQGAMYERVIPSSCREKSGRKGKGMIQRIWGDLNRRMKNVCHWSFRTLMNKLKFKGGKEFNLLLQYFVIQMSLKSELHFQRRIFHLSDNKSKVKTLIMHTIKMIILNMFWGPR